jgi:asparagine synthetase B (glutamine-hydrolysing)
MPGIAGCINLNRENVAPELAAQLIAPLMHEPFYKSATVRTPPNCAMVLIDPDVKDPLCGTFYDHASGIGVTYYGEFYNEVFRVVKNSDHVCRALIDMFQKLGEKIARRLNGSFIVCLSDPRNDRMLIFNDHYASRPLFYYHKNNRLIFAPELKGIAAVPGVDRRINPHAFISFILNGHVLDQQTFFKDIHPLQPGTMLKIENGDVSLKQYWVYVPSGAAADLGEKYYVDELSGLLMQAVEKRLGDTSRLAIPLSGGVDSRGILACVRKLTDTPIKTVSWGTDETTEGADAWVGRQISKLLNTDHTFMRRESEHFTRDMTEMVHRIDGLNDDTAFHHNELSTMRRIRLELGADTIMRGEECFGPRPQVLSDAEVLISAGLFRLEDLPSVEAVLNPDLIPDLRRGCDEQLDLMLKNCPSEDFTDRRDHFYFMQRMVHYHSRSRYYKLSVLNVRDPWLDRDVLDFMQGVPIHYRFKKYLYHKTLHTMFPEIMAVPIAKKHSLEDWPRVLQQNAAMQHFIRQNLLENRNAFHELLNMPGLSALIAKTIQGQVKPPLKVRMLNQVKSAVQKISPNLYRRIKGKISGHLRVRHIPPQNIVFRMLVSKVWFDQFHGAA